MGFSNQKTGTGRRTLLTGAFSLAAAAMMTMPAFAIEQDIVILHTNDIHCGIEDNIGYTGLAWYTRQMEAQTLCDACGRRRCNSGSSGGNFV